MSGPRSPWYWYAPENAVLAVSGVGTELGVERGGIGVDAGVDGMEGWVAGMDAMGVGVGFSRRRAFSSAAMTSPRYSSKLGAP